MKKNLLILCATIVCVILTACSTTTTDSSTLIYGSSDYTRINPAMDEHGEINALLFDGLMDYDNEQNLTTGLASSYEIDGSTYTFTLREDITWHDGEAFTAEDVKFTIEAIQDPDNGSEIASNYADVVAINILDDYTIEFVLESYNAAFLDYMTIGILPEHCLAGEDMQTSDFFLAPIGTGPYVFADWQVGQSITLVANENYYKQVPEIEQIIFKIIDDDTSMALQLQTGEIDFAMLSVAVDQQFDSDEYTVYQMETADYRGIMYNFNTEFWQTHADVIPALNYAFDRDAMVDAVLYGKGEVAYSPIQKNEYHNSEIDYYDYDPALTEAMLEELGYSKGDDGIYQKDGERLAFTLVAKEGETERINLATVAAAQLQAVGVDCTVEVTASPDWENQDAYLIGWGSPYDADDHTYKVFGTDQGSNYSSYSNALVDEYLTLARSTDDADERAMYYALFEEEMVATPAYSFFVYLDALYVSNVQIENILSDLLLGHHGVGIFLNVEEWTMS